MQYVSADLLVILNEFVISRMLSMYIYIYTYIYICSFGSDQSGVYIRNYRSLVNIGSR